MSLHIVGEDGQLQSSDAIDRYLEASLSTGSAPLLGGTAAKTLHGSRVKATGIQYHVVGVFGGQSSGKSTLLNGLFGTSFETMDEESGRHQTTRGAFLARHVPLTAAASEDAAAQAPLFVMDFEGTDGMERGEDQHFERQLSLFALSAADILIINMWANDVGRYNAANMALLRTIFEVNLQLFSHEAYTKEEKPTLLIVLRDSTEHDLQKYYDIVYKSLSKIWETITKTSEFEGCDITAFFTLRYHALPHFKLQRARFDEEMLEFRRWFSDPLCPKFLFRSTVSYRRIPLEMLGKYFSSCWQSIQSSKDLDIPTQRDLVAQHRCSQSFEAIAAQYEALLSKERANLHAGTLTPRLETRLQAEAEKAVDEFDAATTLYSRRIVGEYRAKLHRALSESAAALIQLQTDKLVEKCMKRLDEEAQVLVDDAIRSLVSNKDLIGGRLASSDAGERVQAFWCSINRGLMSMVDDVASGKMSSCFGSAQHLVEEDSLALERAVQQIHAALVQCTRDRMKSFARDACDTMMRGFDYVLTHKEDGTVRFFSTPKGLENAFPAARLAGLLLLASIAYCRFDADETQTTATRFLLKLPSFVDGDTMVQYPADEQRSPQPSTVQRSRTTTRSTEIDDEEEEDDELGSNSVLPAQMELQNTNSTVFYANLAGVDPADVMMSRAAVRRAFDLYSQRILFSIQLQRQTIESSQQNIPLWVWIVILVLGHNEIMFIVTSPVLLLFVAVVAYVFCSAWIANQWQRFEEMGPRPVVVAVKTMQAVIAPHVKPFLDRLPAPPAPPAATPNSAAAK